MKKRLQFRGAVITAFLLFIVLAGTIVAAIRSVPQPSPVEVVQARYSTTATEPLIININTADKEDLIRLPGVGEVIAGRIVDYRKEHGEFKAVEDLLNVKGIGEKTLEGLKPYITIV